MTSAVAMLVPGLTPMAWAPSAPELILIVLVIVLLFGAKKLPDLARGSGRALRIFKSETRGLMDDDDKSETDESPRPLTSGEEAQRRATQGTHEQSGATAVDEPAHRPTDR